MMMMMMMMMFFIDKDNVYIKLKTINEVYIRTSPDVSFKGSQSGSPCKSIDTQPQSCFIFATIHSLRQI